MLEIEYVYGGKAKEKPIEGAPLGFGKIFTDHMFLMAVVTKELIQVLGSDTACQA